MTRTSRLLPLAAAVALTGALAACGTTTTAGTDATAGATSAAGGAAAGSTGDAGLTTLTVLAAASLRDVFTELETTFEEQHPDVEVVLSFAGSSDLADQIAAGAPADVFASADERTMARVVEAGDAADPQVFATNTLALVTPPDDPAGVTTFADLAREDVAVVVCAPEVPCGAATDTVAQAAGVRIHRVSEEGSVTDVLAKVTAGEADAGLVYVTDARLAGDDVAVVDGDDATRTALAAATNRYPVAVLTGSAHPDVAAAWVDLVTGADGRAALERAGFGAP